MTSLIRASNLPVNSRRWQLIGAVVVLGMAGFSACSGSNRRLVIPQGDAGAAGQSGPDEHGGASAGGSGGVAAHAGSMNNSFAGAEGGAAGAEGGAAGTQSGAGGAESGAAGEGPMDPPGCALVGGSTLSAAAEGIPQAGLKLWLRGDVGLVLDAQAHVCRWQDQSGNGFDVRQDDPLSRPKAGATLGGKPAISVVPNQTLSRGDVLGIGATSGRTIVAVYALNNASTRFTIYQGDRTTNWAYAGLDDNTYLTTGNRFGCYITSQSYDGDAVTDQLPHVRAFLADSMKPGLSVLSNMHCLKDTVPLALTYRCCEPSQLIGDLSSANTTFVPAGGDATIAEVLFYDGALSSVVLGQLQSTLAARYGITITG